MKRIATFSLLFLLTAIGYAQTCKSTGSQPGVFDYYLLSLSWKPAFCAGHATGNPQECANEPQLGFVVHGLWPQNTVGVSPELCTQEPPVSAADSASVTGLMFGDSLIQHEWTCHGSCSKLAAADYFALIAQARGKVTIPSQFTNVKSALRMSPQQIESAFARANNAPTAGFRVSCQGNQMEEVRVCFSRSLDMIQCAASLTDCRNSSVVIAAQK
jgi:ribonuclease T2